MFKKQYPIAGAAVVGLMLAVELFVSSTSVSAQKPPRRTPRPTATAPVVATATPQPPPGAGGTLVQVPSPNTTDANNRLNSIAVVSANDMWAVGESYSHNGSTRQTLIQRFDGNSWQIVPSPNTSSSNNQLLGVAAVAADQVWAVGYHASNSSPYAQPLIVRFDGQAWNIVPLPPFEGGAKLNAVAARAANDVWAVGTRVSPSTNYWEQTLIMRWDGNSWQVVPSPQVGTSSVLQGVAISAANDVWAVGYSLSGNYTGLALRWDGVAWTTVATNAPTSSRLYAVAAVASNDVWAVGSNGASTYALRWNGASWNTQAIPNGGTNGTNQHSLLGLAVTSANDIWAVGTAASSGLCGGSDASDYRSYALALRWNGSNWQVAQTANPSSSTECNGTRNDLYGVSVVNGQAVAVGAFYNPASNVQLFQTLIERGQ